jgi:predicted enzyme related to lactoylglutathione lyase
MYGSAFSQILVSLKSSHHHQTSGEAEMPRVIHFEIPVDNVERAVKFYSDVFGWKIQKWGPQDYWLVETGEKGQPGINGAMTKRMEPTTNTVNTIDVPLLDEYLTRITKGGGKVLTSKTAIPGVGYFAYCQDTEGDAIGVLQSDETAK